MAKEELLEFEGEVTEELPDGNFRVKLDNDHEVLAYTAGKMKKNRIRILAGADPAPAAPAPPSFATGWTVHARRAARQPA